jgi:isocitrate dehydrogenase kinase/phosphatase
MVVGDCILIEYPCERDHGTGQSEGQLNLENEIASTILAGFGKHYRIFRETAATAQGLFERAGRMADTLEYSDVAFPLDRFDAELLAEVEKNCGSIVERDGQQVIIKHLYIERRMTPREREIFLELHRDIVVPEGWTMTREAVRAGHIGDAVPYPQSLRFAVRFADRD